MARCWSRGSRSPLPAARLPDGLEVSTFTFLLLDRGALVREYDWRQASLEDWLYTTAYFVSDGALKCTFLGERFGGRETNEISVELQGLVPSPAPAFEVLRSLVEARDARAREARDVAQRERDAMLDGFRRALRDVPGAGNSSSPSRSTARAGSSATGASSGGVMAAGRGSARGCAACWRRW